MAIIVDVLGNQRVPGVSKATPAKKTTVIKKHVESPRTSRIRDVMVGPKPYVPPPNLSRVKDVSLRPPTKPPTGGPNWSQVVSNTPLTSGMSAMRVINQPVQDRWIDKLRAASDFASRFRIASNPYDIRNLAGNRGSIGPAIVPVQPSQGEPWDVKMIKAQNQKIVPIGGGMGVVVEQQPYLPKQPDLMKGMFSHETDYWANKLKKKPDPIKGMFSHETAYWLTKADELDLNPPQDGGDVIDDWGDWGWGGGGGWDYGGYANALSNWYNSLMNWRI